YYDYMWSPFSVFRDLIRSKFLDLNTFTGTAYQLRDFKTGSELEKPLPIQPVERGSYYCLEVEVWGEPKTPRLVRMKFHRLVYFIAQGDLTYEEWVHLKDKEIHHKDGDTSHNWISNLVALNHDQHVEINKQTEVYNKPKISRDDPVVQEILQ